MGCTVNPAECELYYLYIPDPIHPMDRLLQISPLTSESLSNCDLRSCSNLITALAKIPVRLPPKGKIRGLLVEEGFHLRPERSPFVISSSTMAFLCQAERSRMFSDSELSRNVFALLKTSRFKALSLATYLLNCSSKKDNEESCLELIRLLKGYRITEGYGTHVIESLNGEITVVDGPP